MTAGALTACQNVTLMTVSAIAILWTIPETGFSSILTGPIFLLIALSALFSVLMKVLFYIATTHLTVNRLSVFMQMVLLIQVFIDIELLGATFLPI